MPGLYGNTTTNYTVSATSVSTLYLGSTTTFTATTYSTNLAGLYGGTYAPLPTNAQQLIQLFDNSGNVHFFLDPATGDTTIYATVNLTTGTIGVGNFNFAGNTITNSVSGPINLYTNGYEWTFNNDGTTSFPNYTFPLGHGTAGQVLADDGNGDLYWTTIEGGVTDLAAGQGIALSSNTGSVTITNIGVRAITAGSGISVSTSTGTVNIVNTGVKSITAGTGTYVSTSTGDIVVWTNPPSPPLSTAYDFGTILAPVSYTLDMGPIIV